MSKPIILTNREVELILLVRKIAWGKCEVTIQDSQPVSVAYAVRTVKMGTGEVYTDLPPAQSELDKSNI